MDENTSDADSEPYFLPEEHFDLFQRIATDHIPEVVDCSVSHSLQEAIIHLTDPDTTVLDPYRKWFDFTIETLYPADEPAIDGYDGDTYRVILSANEHVEHASLAEVEKRYRRRRIDDRLADLIPIECPNCREDAVGRQWAMDEDDAGGYRCGGTPLRCDECGWAAEVDTGAGVAAGEPEDVADRIAAAIAVNAVPDDLEEILTLNVSTGDPDEWV